MDVQSDRDRVQARTKNRRDFVFPELRTRDQGVVNTPFTSIHATTLSLQYAVGSETKAEVRPDSSSYHPQRLDETRYRILQVCRQYVRLI